MRPKTPVLDRVHGIADYTIGTLLLVAPWLCGFSDHRLATATTMTFGAVTIFYSLLTDYELGAFRVIPFGVHLALDVLSAGLLIGSPFLFGFHDRTWIPHTVIGSVEAGLAVAAALFICLRMTMDHMPLRRQRVAH